MAIDTAAKRSSALDHEEVWQWAAPLPDGAIGQGDRQHAIWTYSGILTGAAVTTLIGVWCEPIIVCGNADRIAASAGLERIEESGASERIGVSG